MDDWLSETRYLQTQAYGRDPYTLEGEAQRDYIRWNHTAAVVELSEMLEETRWKPWAVLAEGEPVIPDRKAYIKEAVDTLHFVANMLVAGQVTDEEFWEAYREKMEVNRQRQLRVGGYQSRRGVDKCELCGRSFDDVGESHETGVCTKCSKVVGV